MTIYLCRQTAGFRGFATEELADSVQMALSAMTVLLALQEQDCALTVF